MSYSPPEGVTIGTFTTDDLPATFRSPADAVISYKIYGTEAGVGVETESGEPTGYKIPILNTSEVTENLFDKDAKDTSKGFLANYRLNGETGATVSNSNGNITEYMSVTSQTHYSCVGFGGMNSTDGLCFYDSNHNFISGITIGWSTQNKVDFQTPNNCAYIRACYLITNEQTAMITLTSEYPDHYIPHRYESNYDLFIGSTKLGEEEYLDYGEQKIYKMSGGTLVPTDPPVPLPPILTYKGENTLSSTETLGDIELTGDWLAIMGSTEAESIDIGFTVDADEFIAFVTVDDEPQIQVFDTITMPSSASSFTLQVVSWGREQYTETVYSDLS